MSTLLVVITGVYFYIVLFLAFVWVRMNIARLSLFMPDTDEPVTVVVALRNEEENVEGLMNSLMDQTYSNYRIVLIDDHSTDNTYSVLQRYAGDTITVMRAAGSGKGAALLDAMRGVGEGLVLFADADCCYGERWVETMVKHWVTSDADLLIGPVRISSGWPLQALEYLSVSAITGATASMGWPMMCGGANMACMRSTFKRAMARNRKNHASGSDMMLLSYARDNGLHISFADDVAAVATSSGKNSPIEFFRQRGRWVSNAGAYPGLGAVLFGILVILVQVCLIATLVPIFRGELWYLSFWGIKMLADFCLLWAASILYRQKKLLPLVPVLSALYPFYVLICVCIGLLRQIKWK